MIEQRFIKSTNCSSRERVKNGASAAGAGAEAAAAAAAGSGTK